MTVKNYAPVRVVNPTDGHLIPLLPNQGFVIVLSDAKSELEVKSSFFSMTKKITTGLTTIYFFEQKYNLDLWSRLSKCFLGEVHVIYNELICNLCVTLDVVNKSKSNTISVINPDSVTIKTDINNFIEVVLYDDDLSLWDVNSLGGDSGLKLLKVNQKIILPSTFVFNWAELENDYFSCPRSSFAGGKSAFKEFHYWFKCSFTNFVDGVYSAGKILFKNSSQLIRTLTVNVTVKENRVKTFVSKPEPFISYGSSLMRKNIYLKKIEDTDLHSNRIIYY